MRHRPYVAETQGSTWNLDLTKQLCSAIKAGSGDHMTKTDSSKPARLGRGLASLISTPVEVAGPTPSDSPSRAHATPQSAVLDLPIDAIRPNTRQPRQTFNERSILELAHSIQAIGVMQPVLVRPVPNVSRGTGVIYELIAGERRWRAAAHAGLKMIPAIVRDLNDQSAAEWSIIENIQREDLNAMDRAEAFHRLITEFSLTQQQIAERVGLDRTSVANHLRLLELDDQAKDALRQGLITFGHARCLLGLPSKEVRAQAWDHILVDGWSVRQLEKWVSSESKKSRGDQALAAPSGGSIHIQDLERKLSEHLGTKVRLVTGKKKGSGRIEIDFFTLEQFEGLIKRLGFQP
jgi:ParB family transcriptional regulator, chromosome partitioning protein